MSDEFDLNALIREAVERSKEADPHVIAKRLLPRIPAKHMRAALGECLHHKVREHVRKTRHDLEVDGVAESTPRAPSVGLSKWTSHAPKLRQRFCVDGEWKFLGDMTADDCVTVARDYARRRDENAAWCERFQLLASRLRERGAATVADLFRAGDDLGGLAA